MPARPFSPLDLLGGQWELYDLERDLDELNNVYFDPEYLDRREELKVRLWNLQAELKDSPHGSQPRPERLGPAADTIEE